MKESIGETFKLTLSVASYSYIILHLGMHIQESG